MKTTRIEIIDAFPGHVYPNRQVLVNWHRNAVLHTIVSSMLEDPAPPEKVAHVLKELAHKIEKKCLDLPLPPELEFKSRRGPENWKQFVEDVNRTDRMLNDGSLPLRYDPRLTLPWEETPMFEVMGWKIFRR